jgi:threonine/homoserine/homoserine lactone efflux protein
MVIEPGDLALFYMAALALNLTPGNDMMYVLGQSLKAGARVGLAGALGVGAGGLVHLALVALGVAVVLAEHPMAFDLLRYGGAAYLLWLAVKTLRQRPDFAPAAAAAGGSLFKAFRDGLVVNVLNPKVILFMFAFLPPFVKPANGAPLLQLIGLGLIFTLNGTVVNGLVALAAGRIGDRLARDQSLARWFQRASAGVFGLLALRLVMERK